MNNRLSLKNDQFKFKTSWKLPTGLEEITEYSSNSRRMKLKVSTCKTGTILLETCGCLPIIPKKLPAINTASNDNESHTAS
jgi:hypothetical protein